MNREIMTQIMDRLRQYDRILLFRHVRVDGDCVGATKGLKEILRATWPKKEVLIIDDERSDYLAFLGPDDVSDEDMPAGYTRYEDGLYEDALGVVIDVATPDRISNPKYALCREVIKIDHHIDRVPYGDICWVEEARSSACEMIAAFYEAFRDELRLTPFAATCLYTGMVTDSGRFMYEGVTGDTMRLAGLMLDAGVDTEHLYAHLYLKEADTLKFTSWVYEHMQITRHGVASIFIDAATRRRFGLSFEEASNAVSLLGNIRGCLCWLAFIEAQDSIRVRLRSRFMYVSELAEAYNGGGHACASGATVYSREEMQQLIRDADELTQTYKEKNDGWL